MPGGVAGVGQSYWPPLCRFLISKYPLHVRAMSNPAERNIEQLNADTSGSPNQETFMASIRKRLISLIQTEPFRNAQIYLVGICCLSDTFHTILKITQQIRWVQQEYAGWKW
jgi:hypothetical protein